MLALQAFHMLDIRLPGDRASSVPGNAAAAIVKEN
jgi:hypothetical protein